MKTGLYLAMLGSFVVAVLTANGVDLFAPTSVATFTCMKNAGNSFAAIRAFRSSGILDTNAAANLQNARTAGLATDIYMFPCRGKDATAQVNTLFSGLSSNLYSTVWIDAETNPSSGCSWSGHTASSNCDFIMALINGITSHGKTAGIYSSLVQWQGIFGSSSACTTAAKAPLWYAHYDNVQSFSDFKPFAGWSSPKLKQYQGDVTLCSTDVDKSWHP
jgi:GH25 family lysozyme M1 (1,4-beta-N-acetylmuramidase)